MNVALLSNEFPPNIYGGAGVHVDFLTRELRKHTQVQVFCFGDQDVSEDNLTVKGVKPLLPPSPNEKLQKVFGTLDNNLQMTQSLQSADVVHCHTWYSHFAGIMAKIALNIPLFLTTHSLEPHRPWKVEQLGRGYDMSSWIEKTAYQEADGIIAVSEKMRQDVIDAYQVDAEKVKVIYNGIDLDFYQAEYSNEVLEKQGIDPNKEFVLFVGRITRQKGIAHLVQAIPLINPDAQIVLCAGAPDTKELEEEISKEIAELQAKREGIIWIREMLDHSILRVLYSHAAVFSCPSVYEPFGIINLEAMACETPVVGSEVGGIPEIIIDGITGLLVPLVPESSTNFEPKYPKGFQQSMANKINQLLDNKELRTSMGKASRQRVEEVFSWKIIAEQTLAFYAEVIENRKRA